MKYSSCTGEPRERQVFDIQRKIVAHMTSESWQKIPHVAYVYEPDVSKFFQEFRSMNSDGSRTQKITFNTLMLRTIVEGLKAAPFHTFPAEFLCIFPGCCYFATVPASVLCRVLRWAFAFGKKQKP